ncbi:hypothetical protein D3C87_1856530 [compost metagenome]
MTTSSATVSMHATTNTRSALNLIRVFQAACSSAATNTRAVASTVYSLVRVTLSPRHVSAAVSAAAAHY